MAAAVCTVLGLRVFPVVRFSATCSHFLISGVRLRHILPRRIKITSVKSSYFNPVTFSITKISSLLPRSWSYSLRWQTHCQSNQTDTRRLIDQFFNAPQHRLPISRTDAGQAHTVNSDSPSIARQKHPDSTIAAPGSHRAGAKQTPRGRAADLVIERIEV